MDSPTSIFAAILTAFVGGSLISAILGWVAAQKRLHVENVTQERSKWREQIRCKTSEAHNAILQGNGEAIDRLKSEFILLLNPDECEDQRIVESIRDEKDTNKRRKIADNLVIRVSYLLKHDWERAKLEATNAAFKLKWLRNTRKVVFEPERRKLPSGLYDDLKSDSRKCCQGTRSTLGVIGRALGFMAASFGAYVALHAVFEARHDRQMNESLFERNVFISMVSSGNQGDFITAMKTFGRIQRMEINVEPLLWKAWNWSHREYPNRIPLWQWAKDRLNLCEPNECGVPNSANQRGKFRIDLHRADLRGTSLGGVNFSRSNLTDADLSEAVLTLANFQYARLWDASLPVANLIEAKLQHADLYRADLQNALLGKANLENAKLEEVDFRYADLQFSNLRFADFRNANLRNANLRNADLRNAVGIVCSELAKALNWKLAIRDEKSGCGAVVPTQPDMSEQ